VAWLFTASGLWAAVSMAGAVLLNDRITLYFAIIGLWIGPGLLRHEARYRTWALRLLLLGFCVAPLFVVILIVRRPSSVPVNLFGRQVGTVSVSAALALVALTVAITGWQYWVLRRPDVRALFVDPPVEHPGASV
jgi:hypothetical protein